jgi:hypothetical protein
MENPERQMHKTHTELLEIGNSNSRFKQYHHSLNHPGPPTTGFKNNLHQATLIVKILNSQINLKSVGHTMKDIYVYQLLSHGRWFSPGTPASSTTKLVAMI